MNIVDVTNAVQEFAAVPTLKITPNTRAIGFVSMAWLMLLAEFIHPPLGHDFRYLVAGLLGGYLIICARDWQRRRRSV